MSFPGILGFGKCFKAQSNDSNDHEDSEKGGHSVWQAEEALAPVDFCDEVERNDCLRAAHDARAHIGVFASISLVCAKTEIRKRTQNEDGEKESRCHCLDLSCTWLQEFFLGDSQPEQLAAFCLRAK